MLNVLGIEAGIGSMLIPAKKLGLNIIGNIETRNQFYTGTFEKNFLDSFLIKKYDGRKLPKIDILVSQPKCGNFSSMSWANSGGKSDMSKKQSKFPLVVNFINKIKPKIFFIDNLPKSLLGSPLTWWADQLKDYKIDIEYISNYHYGNLQLKRNRIFIFGWLKDLDNFVFKPGEINNKKIVKDLLDNIDENLMNHDLFPDDYPAPNMSPLTITKAREFFKNFPEGINPSYIRDEMTDEVFYLPEDKKYLYHEFEINKRIGTKKIRWNKHAQTVTSNVNLYHSIRNDPLTCRERAMLQGFPNDFEFVFSNTKQKFGKEMGCQTGQSIPIEFTTYMYKLIINWFNGVESKINGHRHLSNDLVENSKKDYCKKYGKLNCETCVCNETCEWCKL